jgi:hypothetical protein
MAENNKKGKKPDNFHVRFRPDQADWLRDKVKPKHRNVPELLRKIVDKEIVKEEIERERKR